MNGILSILKPPGMTSNDAVSFLRRTTGIKKIGHTGTLDPGAAGVLPLCIQKATKIVDFIMDDKKTYICELTLGNSTDTYDKYGNFILPNNNPVGNITYNDFMSVLDNFKGIITQTPPVYSAIKINGQRAYNLARKGESFEVPSRQVTIYSIELVNYELPYIMLKIVCSKGTYIRSICNDIGNQLGCGGYMSFLIRTQTGNFNLRNSYPLEEINRDNFIDLVKPTEFALNFESIYIDRLYEDKLLNGNSLILNKDKPHNNCEFIKVFIESGEFIGIGKINNNVLYMLKVLA